MASLVAAEPRLVVQSFCPFSVHIHLATDRMVAGDENSKIINQHMITLEQGQTWVDNYRRPALGGVVFKLAKSSPTSGDTPTTQFEYVYFDEGGRPKFQFDISNVDCDGNNGPRSPTGPCPFTKYGMIFEHQGCTTRECKPNDTSCAYNYPTDDIKTDACFTDENPDDSFLYLCNYNVPSFKLRKSRHWHRDILSAENIHYIETQLRNSTQFH
jgi:hypothetical protein